MGKSVKRLFLSKLVMIVFLLLIFLVPFLVKTKQNVDAGSLISFIINGFLFAVGIYFASKKHSVSMELIYWMFMFFFMYFAPIIQNRSNLYPWNKSVTDLEVVYANLLVFLFNVIFVLGCFIGKKTKFVGFPDAKFSSWLCGGFEFKKASKIFLTIVMCACAAYSLSKTGILGIVVSRTQSVQVFYSGDNSAIELVVESVIPSFMAYIVAESAYCVAMKKEKGVRFLIVFLCLLICFFPTAIPRYKVATIYGVIFIVLLPKITKGTRFFWLFTFGLFLIFPLMSAFRNIISFEHIQETISEDFFESYTDGNYDAWRMLVSAIEHNAKHGATLGAQLLGVFLFFMPSSMWPSKPIGSGAMLIQSELGSNAFSNVSCPFIAEGYVNFGIMGIVIFALLLGVLITKLDMKYWANVKLYADNGMFAPYLFFVFMLFFVLRGDLLSSFAYVCGFLATGILLKPFIK